MTGTPRNLRTVEESADVAIRASSAAVRNLIRTFSKFDSGRYGGFLRELEGAQIYLASAQREIEALLLSPPQKGGSDAPQG